MQEQHLYEYAVIRVVPRAEREEFLNVGVILYTHQSKFLHTIYSTARLTPFAGIIDINEVDDYLRSFERICKAAPGSGAIGRLDAASRFRWLTAYRSTIVQTSRVHPGLCLNPEMELQRLFEKLVL